ncbi:hypothetical protein KPL70_001811 [Citrus sinensis]|nr:hypothetical protein KPL70_001811 [Citrus sinensis]
MFRVYTTFIMRRGPIILSLRFLLGKDQCKHCYLLDDDDHHHHHDDHGAPLMSHDDILGDEIPYEQQQGLSHFCYQALGDQLNIVNNSYGQFPFLWSHPLSLNRDSLQLLRQRYFYATWNADGTRHMMLVTMDGCYLIKRIRFRLFEEDTLSTTSWLLIKCLSLTGLSLNG